MGARWPRSSTSPHSRQHLLISASSGYQRQFWGLFPARPATQEESEHCSISLALQRVGVRHLPERLCLVGGQPITEADAEVFRAFDSTDASSEVRAEQTGIGSFVRETSDRREPAVDCARRKLT